MKTATIAKKIKIHIFTPRPHVTILLFLFQRYYLESIPSCLNKLYRINQV